MALEPDAVSSKPGLIKNLLDRRILQLVGVYLGTIWTVSRFVNWLVDRFVLSPYLEDLFMLTALLIAPLVFVLAYGHGAKGKNRWSRTEKIFIPCNVILAVVVLFLLFGGKDLGSAQETVLIVDAEGNEIERVIPKSEFRKRLALFYFDNTSGNEDLDWLRHGLPIALVADLEQDPFFIATTATGFSERLRKANFADGFGVPLALQRQIAEEYNYGYVLTGSVDQQDDRYRIETRLHRVKNGKVVAEHTVEGSDLLALIDEIAAQLKEDLEIPQKHIEETIDLPLAEVMTASLPALRAYVLAGHARAFDQDHTTAITLINEAVAEDPTFAQAYLRQFQGLIEQRRGEEAMQALAAAQQHSYRLTEQQRFGLTTAQFFYTRQPEEALQAARQWSTLYPDDTRALNKLYLLHSTRGETDEAIAALRRINELDPQANRQREIGDLLLSKSQYEEALQEYQAYVDLFPKKKTGYERMALAYRAMGELEQEQAAHRQALIVAPNDPTILANLGEVQLRLGHFDEALAQYGTALAQSRTPGEQAGVQQKQLLYYLLRGDYEHAFDTYETLWESLSAIHPPITIILMKASHAWIYAQAGRIDEAVAMVAQAKTQPSYQTDDFYT
ncbi:MAG: tetratricopeptide repeat protein, partial [Rhodothermales bacterium]